MRPTVRSALRERRRDDEIDIGNEIIFESHPNTLSDMSEEVQQRRHAREPNKTTMRPKNMDQICVYENTNDTRIPLFIVEYKPAHKLSIGDMDIQEVIVSDTIPVDLGERSKQNSDEVVAAVVTQTSHYMIQCGLEYSYITIGEAFVFLQI